MKVEPYLIFNGRCDEALAFYRSAVGAEVISLMRFKDSPEQASCMAAAQDKVMHCSLRIGDSTVMVSDGRCEGGLDFKGISLSLSVANAAEAERVFAALADGGKVQMPIGKTFFASRFGMVADRFGVMWMVIANAQ
jgi:PhnB protein